MTKKEHEAVTAALAAITERDGGVLTPDAVLRAAANRSSVLHPMFEWDGKKAAHAHRLDQARALIRSVRVIITTERTTVSTVAYVRNPEAEPGEQGYVATLSLVGDKELARRALIEEFERAAAALRRARELAIAFDLDGQVEAVTQSVELMRTTVSAGVEQRPS